MRREASLLVLLPSLCSLFPEINAGKKNDKEQRQIWLLTCRSGNLHSRRLMEVKHLIMHLIMDDDGTRDLDARGV